MKRLLIFTCLILSAIFSKAQSAGSNSIIGLLSDSATKKPLEYATVTIYVKGNEKPLTGTTTDATGHYSINDLPAGNYRILFENIGFISHNIADLSITKKDAIIDLKNIALAVNKNTLAAVTVTTQSKLIENKIDKMVFNAEKDLTSQGGVATDILKKIPQVSVDVDGNVQLSGNSGIRFLINGKPSTAFGSNIADVLQSIPASQIKSVEVITNPGAKYDAQGLGGIINIILKTNNTKGYNGNISMTAGTRNENASVNVNARKTNFGLNMFFSGNKRLPATVTNENTRITTNGATISTLQQSSNSRFERGGFQTGAGFDLTLNKHNNISGSFAYNHFSNDGKGVTNQMFQPDKNGSQPEILTRANAANSFSLHNIDASLSYKKTFAKEDQELEISATVSPEKTTGHSSIDQYFLPNDSLYFGTIGLNPAKVRETELTADYTQPLKEDVILGIGGKSVFYHINSASEVNSYDGGTKNYSYDFFLSPNLKYDQKVYAAYAELSFPVGKLFETKVGGRYERTEIDAYFSNAQQQAKIPGYNTFVPSVYLSKKLGDKQSLKLSYSKRIERPDYDALNPYVNTSDPANLSTGNPYLLPELGHRFELAYSRDLGTKGSFMFNLFHRINEQDIQSYIVYYPSYLVGDSVFTNVAVSTRSNIGRENNTGINLFGDMHFTPKFNLRSNLSFYQRHTINTIDKGFNVDAFNYRFNINSSYMFTNTLVAEFFGNFSSARREAQGKYPSFITYSTAIRKQFWNKKGSLALTATNPFSETLKQRTELSGPNFKVNGVREIPFRSIGLNFSWKFGKLEFKKARESDPAAEMGQ